MRWILRDWKLMFQIRDDLFVTWPFLHVKPNFDVLSFATYWSWVKVSIEMFILLFLRRFRLCTRRKAIYTCHCKPGPYRIKAGTNFYSLTNSIPKNYNTKKKENSKQKNLVVMKSPSNNKQGLSITNLNWFCRTRSEIHFCFSFLPNF